MTEWKGPEPEAIALDFDGTLTLNGMPLGAELVSVLRSLRGRGKKVILATGRCLPDIRRLAGEDLFDCVVAENGALLELGGKTRVMAPGGWKEMRASILPHFPQGCEEVIISAPIEMLEKAKDVVKGGQAQVLVNKDRLMVMPTGVDKGTGVAAALESLGVRRDGTACVGDGENDLPMFEASGVRVALGNSVEVLKQRADLVMAGSDVKGTLEGIEALFGLGRAGGAEA